MKRLSSCWWLILPKMWDWLSYTIQVQDGQHRPVMHRVEKFVGMPGRGQRSGLRLAVTHHDRYDQIRIVEGCPIGMGEAVAEFAALME